MQLNTHEAGLNARIKRLEREFLEYQQAVDVMVAAGKMERETFNKALEIIRDCSPSRPADAGSASPDEVAK